MPSGKAKTAIINHEPSLLKRWFSAISTLVVLSFFAITFAGILYLILFGEKTPFGNVAVISVSGVITTEKAKGAFASPTASSEEITKFLKDALKDDQIKAVIIDINSPGGSAVASSEIGDAIMRVREKKPVISVIHEVGASGGYWIASSTERIFANPLSTTGSIGVISSYLEFAGLIENYNVTYQRLVYGKYKDTGSPFRRLTTDERSYMQKELDIVAEAFINTVAKNRHISTDKIREYATGRVFLGSEAKEMGLIDEFGGSEEAVKYLETKLNITVKLTEYQKVPSIIELLSGASSRFNPISAQQMLASQALASASSSPMDAMIPQALVPGDVTVYT